MKINETKLKQIISEEMSALEDKQYFDHVDSEGGMAKSQLYRMAKYAMMLHDALEDDTQLESWVQSKITIATEYMGKVKHYLEYEMNLDLHDPEIDMEHPQEHESSCAPEIEPQGQDAEPLMVMNNDGEISYEITDEDEYLMES
tara:strand:- start:43 stop:474 length:432 start_codon:yes stop_codon:yes gene_type:complete